jgi:hypothetical protein
MIQMLVIICLKFKSRYRNMKIFLVSILILLTSCSQIPVATNAEDREAKLFKPIKDKAIVYVFRDELMGGAVRMDLVFDNLLIGETRHNHYMRIVAKPGKHTMTSRSSDSYSINVNLKPNQIYYFRQEALFGWWTYAKTKLTIVDEMDAQESIKNSELIQHIQPY